MRPTSAVAFSSLLQVVGRVALGRELLDQFNELPRLPDDTPTEKVRECCTAQRDSLVTCCTSAPLAVLARHSCHSHAHRSMRVSTAALPLRVVKHDSTHHGQTAILSPYKGAAMSDHVISYNRRLAQVRISRCGASNAQGVVEEAPGAESKEQAAQRLAAESAEARSAVLEALEVRLQLTADSVVF